MNIEEALEMESQLKSRLSVGFRKFTNTLVENVKREGSETFLNEYECCKCGTVKNLIRSSNIEEPCYCKLCLKKEYEEEQEIFKGRISKMNDEVIPILQKYDVHEVCTFLSLTLSKVISFNSKNPLEDLQQHYQASEAYINNVLRNKENEEEIINE